MAEKKKSVGLALSSLVAGVACLPVAAFFSTVAGLTLATLSVVFIYLAG